MSVAPACTEEDLREMFEENFERLRAESGHSLSPEVKKAAWQQVLMYWRRLRHIAEGVTETEVRLNLPNQESPKGRKFCIEGVVDIVREADRTTMYDIKTHDLEYIRGDLEFYKRQLNVYAHIWQNLRHERLDETAVIGTSVPPDVREAFETGDDARLEQALSRWDPVTPIPFDQGAVEETVKTFAGVVDEIEEGRFRPPPPESLKRREGKDTFATRTCTNCDARFSCSSYRACTPAPKRKTSRNFQAFFATPADDGAREAGLDAGMKAGEIS